MSNKGQEEQTKKIVEAEEPKKTCFVIMPISDAEGYAPGHFERVFKFIIEPACLRAGFKADRSNDFKSTNVIMIKILEQILSEDMAVCDLSSKNPNVFYELGIRQAFDMPVTIIKDDITSRAFDTNSIREVPYYRDLRFDQVNQAVYDLSEAILETYNKKGEELNSLVGLLSIKKAKVETSELSNDTRAILEAINNMSRQNETLNNRIAPFNVSQPTLYPYFVPIEQVYNMTRPSSGTTLKSIGLSASEDLKFGDKVIHAITGKTGTLIGLGSGQGSGVFLVQVDEGPLVAARPEMYKAVHMQS